MGMKKDHMLGSGSAALAGGAAGAAIGSMLAGPAGLAVGAAAGGALGAVAGQRAAEARDPADALGHFEQVYAKMPYYVEGRDWHDYAPAYRFGLEACAAHPGQPLERLDTQLQGRWEAAQHFGSRLRWDEARPAVAHAWEAGSGRRTSPPGSGPA